MLHAPEEVAQVVLVELEALGRRMPDDVSIVSVGSSFDTDTLPTPIDSIPLVPQSSCERAVDLAIELVAAAPWHPACTHLSDLSGPRLRGRSSASVTHTHNRISLFRRPSSKRFDLFRQRSDPGATPPPLADNR